MNISTKAPAGMSCQERINEIAAILADALLRASEGQLNQRNVRGFSGFPAELKRSCDTQKRAAMRTKRVTHEG